MLITKEGIAFLERVVRSCMPNSINGGMAGKKYLYNLSRKQKGIEFDKLKKGFPKDQRFIAFYNVYNHIQESAEKAGVKTIDRDFIIRFFSGTPHIERAIKDVDESGFVGSIGLAYAIGAFLSHVLLIVEISEINGSLASGMFRNGDVEFPVKNLIAFPEEKANLKRGVKVFAHYASIISSDISPEIEEVVLLFQSRHEQFMEACKTISKNGGIDHKRMTHYPWAEKVAKYKSELE